MKCSDVIHGIGFECSVVGERTLRVWSPFTMPGDGEILGVFVHHAASGFRVSDNAAALMSLESRGITLSAARIRTLESLAPRRVKIDAGEILSEANRDELGDSIVDVLQTMMLVGHKTLEWLSRVHGDAFEERVGEILVEAVGREKVQRAVHTTGASGRQMKFPFVLGLSRRMYVQPIAYGRERLNWDNVYRGHGKMHDLQLADVPAENRIVVFEDRAEDPHVGQAITLLSSVATVVPFSRVLPWASRLRSVA